MLFYYAFAKLQGSEPQICCPTKAQAEQLMEQARFSQVGDSISWSCFNPRHVLIDKRALLQHLGYELLFDEQENRLLLRRGMSPQVDDE